MADAISKLAAIHGAMPGGFQRVDAVLVGHGAEAGSHIKMGGGEFMQDNNEAAGQFATGLFAKVRHVEFPVCCMATSFNFNANHLMKSLAVGLSGGPFAGSTGGWDSWIWAVKTTGFLWRRDVHYEVNANATHLFYSAAGVTVTGKV